MTDGSFSAKEAEALSMQELEHYLQAGLVTALFYDTVKKYVAHVTTNLRDKNTELEQELIEKSGEIVSLESQLDEMDQLLAALQSELKIYETRSLRLIT